MSSQATQQQTQWARTKEVTEHFQISAMTLWRWRQLETFPKTLKRSGARNGAVLYDIQAIEQWMA